MQVLIKVTDDSPDGQRLLSWLKDGPAGRHGEFVLAGQSGTLGAADILGTVSDISGLTAIVFQIGAWWTARVRRPGNTPPSITLGYNGVTLTLENADPDHLNSIVRALTSAPDTAIDGDPDGGFRPDRGWSPPG